MSQPMAAERLSLHSPGLAQQVVTEQASAPRPGRVGRGEGG